MAIKAKSARHSDDARRRRSKQTRKVKHLQEWRKRQMTMHTPPPVMARSSMASSSRGKIRKRAKYSSRNVRRRFDVMLNSQGAEMRLPSLPQVHVGWRFISVLMASLLIFVLYQFWNSPVYRVDEAQVEGLKRMNSAAVNAVLDLEGKPVFTLDSNALQRVLLDSFPEFSAALVSVALPDTVFITVTERVPVLLWRMDGRTDLVDAEGVAFPLRDGTMDAVYPVVEAAGNPPLLNSIGAESNLQSVSGLGELAGKPDILPVISGSAKQYLTPEMVSAILMVASQTPEGAPVVYHPEHGLGWKDRRGWDVYFGDVKDIEMKLLVYKAILQKVKSLESRPVMVSVENVHTPYFRMEQ